MTRAAKNAGEADAFSRFRRYVRWRQGELHRIKRAANRRERQEGKREARERAQA
jgi:hypothetical protein